MRNVETGELMIYRSALSEIIDRLLSGRGLPRVLYNEGLLRIEVEYLFLEDAAV